MHLEKDGKLVILNDCDMDNQGYKIYVPSKDRPNYHLKEKVGVPYYLVLDENDSEGYYCSGFSGNEIIIYCPLKGISPKRNWILGYHRKHHPNDYCIMIDDDISGFHYYNVFMASCTLVDLVHILIQKSIQYGTPLVCASTNIFPPNKRDAQSFRIDTMVCIKPGYTSTYSTIDIFGEQSLFGIDMYFESGVMPRVIGSARVTLSDNTPEKSICRKNWVNLGGNLNSVSFETIDAINSKYPGCARYVETKSGYNCTIDKKKIMKLYQSIKSGGFQLELPFGEP